MAAFLARWVCGSFLDTGDDFYSIDFSWIDPTDFRDPYGSDDSYRMDLQEEMGRLMFVMEYRASHNGAYPPAPPQTPRTPRSPRTPREPFSPRTPRERDPPSVPAAPCSPRTPRGTPTTPRKPQSPLAQELLPDKEEAVRPYHHDRHRHGNQRAGRKLPKRKERRRIAKVPSEDLGFYS
jgi:hypothetical protein